MPSFSACSNRHETTVDPTLGRDQDCLGQSLLIIATELQSSLAWRQIWRCMKVIYLDQNHWIELSRAAHGRASRPNTPVVLDALRKAQAAGRACVPISLAHYIETYKQQKRDSRSRLASVMLALAAGRTVAPPHVVVRHEIEMALEHFYPGRISPGEFHFVGSGLTHAADKDFSFPLKWPAEANGIPASQRAVFERRFLMMAEYSLLTGILPTGQAVGPATDLTAERRFKADLEEWRGAAKRYSPEELEDRIYRITLKAITGVVNETLARHKISPDTFAHWRKSDWRAFLDDMPSQRADMHLRREWAKNASLKPKDSDLNDWAYVSVAVCYSDIVVTEKQIADLFRRGSNLGATVLSELDDLADLVA